MTLKDYMERHSITAALVAGRLGVSLSAVYKWIQGNRTPRMHVIRQIVQLTDGEVSYEDWQ